MSIVGKRGQCHERIVCNSIIAINATVDKCVVSTNSPSKDEIKRVNAAGDIVDGLWFCG